MKLYEIEFWGQVEILAETEIQAENIAERMLEDDPSIVRMLTRNVFELEGSGVSQEVIQQGLEEQKKFEK